MSWDTDAHHEQNDHAEGTMPMYAGTQVIGRAANFALPDGRHNALRWHEFSRMDALRAEPLVRYDLEMRAIPGERYTVETPQEPDDGDADEHIVLGRPEYTAAQHDEDNPDDDDRESGAEYISRVQHAEATLNG